MTRAFLRWLAWAALTGLAVAGCTTNGSTGSGTGTSSATVTSSQVATTSASPSSSGPSASPTGPTMPLPVDLPVAAREHSPAGAEAFVRFFYAQVNRAWTRPEAGLIPRLCLSTSKSCAALEVTASELVAKKQRYDGDPGMISRVLAMGSGAPTELSVDVLGRQERRNVIDANGAVVLTDPQQDSHFEVHLRWFSDGWRVVEILGVKG
ncbi:MAG: hypothetical protein IPM08_03645 [Actinomycetales bacterium]|nr:hypothetical protein [Actinomycetales bacterium]